MSEPNIIYRPTKGKRVKADGTVVEYIYQKKYVKRNPEGPETRGRKECINKKELRNLIKDLSDEKCKEIIDLIKQRQM